MIFLRLLRYLFRVCTISLVLVWPLSPQIFNVEKIRLDHPENKVIFGNIGTNFAYHNRTVNLQTPTRVFTGGLTGDVGYFSDDHLYMLISNYQLLFVNDNKVVNFGSTHARTQFFHKNTVSPEIYGQYQYDEARGLQLRLLAGAGPRWRILKTDALNLAVGTGAMFESEDWRDPVRTNQPMIYARYLKSSTYFGTRYHIKDNVDLNAVIYYQVGYDRDYDQTLHRVSGDLNLAFAVFEKLSFTTAFNAAWESRPIVPIIPFIFSVTNGIRFKF